jgi:hypothetical protein
MRSCGGSVRSWVLTATDPIQHVRGVVSVLEHHGGGLARLVVRWLVWVHEQTVGVDGQAVTRVGPARFVLVVTQGPRQTQLVAA